MSSQAVRVYTKHGIRAHYARGNQPIAVLPDGTKTRPLTYCDRDAYDISERSRFFRRRLAQASVCGRCEKDEEALS